MKLSISISLFLLATSASADTEDICVGTCQTKTDGTEECIFTAHVNLFAGELGYYQFEECNGQINPTIGIEVGKTYRFLQSDRSNWYHPLGFAYKPDGAHADVDELEPGILPEGSTSGCDVDHSCPAPMYFMGDEYLGKYSNDESLVPTTVGEEDFGLDHYEPKFFHPPVEWTEYGDFSVTVKFDDVDYQKDIFYFCHIHQFMTGRIKLLKDGEPLQELNTPQLGYEYDSPSDYDNECGTFGLEMFQLPHDECPEKFVCDVPAENTDLVQFAGCIDSMNCHMMAGMTTKASTGSRSALFLHQMIPHHQNAVNMAKALLKSFDQKCLDLTEESDDCALEIILREIINTQNGQIQTMRAILESKGYPADDDCTVNISGIVEDNTTTEASDTPDIVKYDTTSTVPKTPEGGSPASLLASGTVTMGALAFATALSL